MSKVYNIKSTPASSQRECCQFEIKQTEVINEHASTYFGILNIFREIFDLVDITQIIKKR